MRGEVQILQKKSPIIACHFLLYHKINLRLGISIFEQLFFFFLKYESFSNRRQSYCRNIGYFEGIYKCKNLTFHL